MECPNSGLTDYQWYKEHGIRPSTFYNWVSPFRKKACYAIPAPVSGDSLAPSGIQEVAKLAFGVKAEEPALISIKSCQPVPTQVASRNPVIKISLDRAIMRINNGVKILDFCLDI